jgi:hypothetical protein
MCNRPGFYSSILQHSRTWGVVANQVALNKVQKGRPNWILKSGKNRKMLLLHDSEIVGIISYTWKRWGPHSAQAHSVTRTLYFQIFQDMTVRDIIVISVYWSLALFFLYNTWYQHAVCRIQKKIANNLFSLILFQVTYACISARTYSDLSTVRSCQQNKTRRIL